MTDNPCLRPACLSDIYPNGLLGQHKTPHFFDIVKHAAIKDLYNAEWRKRGLERSP